MEAALHAALTARTALITASAQHAILAIIQKHHQQHQLHAQNAMKIA